MQTQALLAEVHLRRSAPSVDATPNMKWLMQVDYEMHEKLKGFSSLCRAEALITQA